jgi:sugar-specific transcriptional regulator TrmB
MSDADAVGALKRLGLSNYEARVFVALQALGEATAKELSEQSEVPRSQVYGAADELAERGLLEVVESAPKAYRPVSLEAARAQLHARFEREEARAFETLEALRDTASTGVDEEAIATLRGRAPITERIRSLIETANAVIAFAAPAESALPSSIADPLRDRAEAGVAVQVMTAEPSVAELFESDPIDVFVMAEDNPADFAGRALMVDGTSVLLAVEPTDQEETEQALWTAGTTLGHILSRFMQSGMQSGIESQNPSR